MHANECAEHTRKRAGSGQTPSQPVAAVPACAGQRPFVSTRVHSRSGAAFMWGRRARVLLLTLRAVSCKIAMVSGRLIPENRGLTPVFVTA